MARGHLQSLDAAVVLVAHDRWFLEAVGTAVLELEAGRGRFFEGTWHAWRKEKAARELALGRAIERQEAEIARLERFVDRFRAGTRARQAQSRVKKLDKIERIARDPRDGRSLGFAFKPPERTGASSSSSSTARCGSATARCSSDAEMWLERGEHVSLVGPNGTGKTTLIETLAGARELAGGKLRRGHNVKLGLLLPARGGARRQAARSSRRRRRRPGSRRTRRARCSAASCSPARRPRSPSTGCRAASGGGCRWPLLVQSAPTS